MGHRRGAARLGVDTLDMIDRVARFAGQRSTAESPALTERGDLYEARMAATDQSPFAVTRRQAELVTGIAMRDWTGPHLWIRAWHQDLTLIEAARRGVLPRSLATQLEQALGNEVARWSEGGWNALPPHPQVMAERSRRDT